MHNIWLHLCDETCPQIVKDHIDGFREWKRTEGANTTAHLKFPVVLTLFYPTSIKQQLVKSYSPSVPTTNAIVLHDASGNRDNTRDGHASFIAFDSIADGFSAFTVALYDTCGTWLRTDLYKNDQIWQTNDRFQNYVTIKCDLLLRKENGLLCKY